jgi:hypothetical protein
MATLGSQALLLLWLPTRRGFTLKFDRAIAWQRGGACKPRPTFVCLMEKPINKQPAHACYVREKDKIGNSQDRKPYYA